MDNQDFQLNIFNIVKSENKKKGIEAYEIIFKDKKIFEKGEDIFSGFTTLKAITFSSSIKFISELFNNFDNIEILFGNENVLGNINEVVKFQLSTIYSINEYFSKEKRTKDKDLLISKIEDDKLRMYLCKKKSHAKLFLLSNEQENKYRVITGSSNLSKLAFSGNQNELIYYSDNKDDYDMLLNFYNQEKTDKFNIINSKDVLSCEDIKEIAENIENYMPIFCQIENDNIIIDENDIKEIEEDDEFIIFERDYKKIIENSDINFESLLKSSKKNKLKVLTLDKKSKLSELINKNLNVKREKQKEKILPILLYNDVENKLFLDNRELLLNYTTEGVKTDLNIINKVFNSYNEKIFKHGNLKDSKEKLFATLNYMFCSPFISVARFYAEKNHVGISTNAYPLNLILYGKSGSEKSWNVRFFQKLCFNDILQFNPTEITPVKFHKIRYDMQGFPIFIDDIDEKRWRDYQNKVKSDVYELKNVSPVIMTTNFQLAIDTQYNKRVARLYVDTYSSKDKNLIRNLSEPLLNNITRDLYRCYLRKMLNVMPSFLEKMLDINEKDFDILLLSSRVLKECFEEYFEGKVPEYCKEYSTEYYLITANDLFKKNNFLNKFQEMKDLFVVDKEKNRIYMEVSDKEEANKYLSDFGEDLIVEISQNKVNFDLKKCREYFEYSLYK